MLSLKRKVFLISDHPIIREGLTVVVNRESDLEVCGAVGNSRASRAIADLNPDVVIIDLSFDARKGIDAIKEITIRSPRLPVLVLSAYCGDFYVEHVLRAGAKGYVLKQETTSTVISAIRQVLNGRTYLSETMSSTLLERYIDGLSGAEKTGGVGKLSSRELLVLQLIGEGMTTKQIADRLCVSIKTIETYRTRIKTKLNIKAHPDLIQYAIRWAKSSCQL